MTVLKVAMSMFLMILIMINGIMLIDYFEERKRKRLERRRKERNRLKYVRNYYKKYLEKKTKMKLEELKVILENHMKQ